MLSDDQQSKDQNHYLSSRTNKVIQPLDPGLTPAKPSMPVQQLVQATSTPNAPAGDNPAVELIRQKVQQLFVEEPPAEEERQEADAARFPSKHQQFMHQLSTSGKSVEEIQLGWHEYYASLTDTEKQEVWQEFYAVQQQEHSAPKSHDEASHTAKPDHKKTPEPEKQPAVVPATKTRHTPTKEPDGPRTVAEVRKKLLHTVESRTKTRHKQHMQSLLFGLSMGSVVVAIMMFGFFNERFIAPFMTPSRAVTNTPIIIDPNSSSVGKDPKIIIPKINVEIPVVYDVKTIEESAVQEGLERGVVHYATTPMPGEQGNGVIFGHSANNILNKGKYKFAFVLLKKLELGDTFYIEKDGKRYVYKIYDKKIVPPTDVSVLNRNDKPATFTLITCDPPGTTLNRLVVIGEQVSPDPASNTESSVVQDVSDKPAELPSDAPTLWSRVWGWLGG